MKKEIFKIFLVSQKKNFQNILLKTMLQDMYTPYILELI